MQGDALTLAAFAGSHGDKFRWGSGPLLVVRPSRSASPDEDTFVFDTPSRSTLASTNSTKIDPSAGGPTGDYLLPNALVIPVRKGANPFPLISVGRARNNDVCISDPSVSKVHAYFASPDKAESHWRIKDAKSLNGTIISLASGPQKIGEDLALIEHGTELRFGVVRCLFTDQETLQNAVTWASRSWKKA